MATATPNHTAQRASYGDSVEFVEFPDAATPATKPAKAAERRFGLDPRHAHLFETFRKECEPLLRDPRFLAELDHELLHVARRPSSMLHLKRLSHELGGAQIFLKRE